MNCSDAEKKPQDTKNRIPHLSSTFPYPPACLSALIYGHSFLCIPALVVHNICRFLISRTLLQQTIAGSEDLDTNGKLQILAWSQWPMGSSC
jgi:hypothetical protein